MKQSMMLSIILYTEENPRIELESCSKLRVPHLGLIKLSWFYHFTEAARLLYLIFVYLLMKRAYLAFGA